MTKLNYTDKEMMKIILEKLENPERNIFDYIEVFQIITNSFPKNKHTPNQFEVMMVEIIGEERLPIQYQNYYKNKKQEIDSLTNEQLIENLNNLSHDDMCLHFTHKEILNRLNNKIE